MMRKSLVDVAYDNDLGLGQAIVDDWRERWHSIRALNRAFILETIFENSDDQIPANEALKEATSIELKFCQEAACERDYIRMVLNYPRNVRTRQMSRDLGTLLSQLNQNDVLNTNFQKKNPSPAMNQVKEEATEAVKIQQQLQAVPISNVQSNTVELPQQQLQQSSTCLPQQQLQQQQFSMWQQQQMQQQQQQFAMWLQQQQQQLAIWKQRQLKQFAIWQQLQLRQSAMLPPQQKLQLHQSAMCLPQQQQLTLQSALWPRKQQLAVGPQQKQQQSDVQPPQQPPQQQNQLDVQAAQQPPP